MSLEYLPINEKLSPHTYQLNEPSGIFDIQKVLRLIPILQQSVVLPVYYFSDIWQYVLKFIWEFSLRLLARDVHFGDDWCTNECVEA